MLKLIMKIFLKYRCRRIYKQLPVMAEMQLFFEMCQPQNKGCSYFEILKREFELNEVDNASE